MYGPSKQQLVNCLDIPASTQYVYYNINAESPPIHSPGAQGSPYPPEYIYFPPKRTRRQQIRLFFNRGFIHSLRMLSEPSQEENLDFL